MSINELRNSHPGETFWIVGKGPSLQYLTAEHFGNGPVIAINTAVAIVQSLHLPNPLYLLEKDGLLGNFIKLREDVIAILQLGEGFSENCFSEHPRRVLVDPVAEMGFLDTEMSARIAIRIALAMGCKQINFMCCDSITTEEYHYLDIDGEVKAGYAGAYKRVRALILKEVAEIPHKFIIPEAEL